MRDEQGNTHAIIQQNQDLNAGWLCGTTDRYTDQPISRGGEFGDEVEAVIDSNGTVQSIHENSDGVPVPENGWVLIGRTTSGQWILDHLTVGEKLVYGRNTAPDWREYPTLVGGGPRIVVDGVIHTDPILPFKVSDVIENFTVDYNTTYYQTRQPRTAIGADAKTETLYWVAVDVRQSGAKTSNELFIDGPVHRFGRPGRYS